MDSGRSSLTMGKDCAARFSRRSLGRKDRAGRLGRDGGGAEGVLEVDDKKKKLKEGYM